MVKIASERQTLERIKILRQQNIKTAKIYKQETKELEDRKKRWVVFWRNNIELYIYYKLGIRSFPYQMFAYHVMQDATTYSEVSTRGASKTFKALVVATAKCMLYPGFKVIVGAVTKSQAQQDFSETFRGEIVEKFSPYLKWLAKNGYITWKETEKGYEVSFWNGSTISFCPVIDSSRGLHGCLIIVEECRLIKKNLVDSILVPMHTQRQPLYKTLPQYVMRRDLDEPVQIYYITSNRFASEWFNTLHNHTFVNYFIDKLNKHRIFSADIFLAIKYGLKSKAWLIAQKNSMDEMNYRMELLNETCGEAENAYFTLEMFKKNQVLKDCFVPLETEQYVNNSIKNRPKNKDEVRLLFVDFSFVSTYKGGTDNDNTVIGCLSIVKKSDKWIRQVEYVETYGGSEAETYLRRIREIRQDYEADYIVFDSRSGGEILFNDLSKEYLHPTRPFDTWDSRGLTIANEKDIHVVSDGKLQDMKQRTIDKNAVACLIPISGTPEFNSNAWLDLGRRLRSEEISFLIDDLEYEQRCVEEKGYYKLTSEEKAQKKIGYIQTTLLINEAINLSQEWRGGVLKLTEPRQGYKDRIVALSYGNYIATKIITQLEKNESSSQEINWNEVQLVF